MAEVEPSLHDLMTTRVATADAERLLGAGTTTFIDTIVQQPLAATDRSDIEPRAVTGAPS